ncbi:hypothetical protein IWW43_003056 [Coemansia sp. RSA 1935]|nr:hypothetical protein IWW43_003056 [Coemansia sp. RSA 1935]
MMAESIDGGRQDDGGSNKRTMPAAGLHPFFTPLSKRANIVTGSDSKLSCDTSSSESKRTKQKASSGAADKRNRKSKSVGKSTTLQSFFSIKPNQNDAQTPELNVMDANDVVSVADAAAEILWQPRPKLRPANPPAPYPTETPHVPAPIFEAFHPVIRAAAMPENKHLGRYCAASIPAALELYAQSQPHVSLDGGSTQWRELAGEIFQLQQQQRMRALSLDGTTGASILASLGAPLRCPPRNLQCTEPLLDILCGRKSHGQGPHSQLLTTRYRPRRARDVLDNCRAVTQLQSWIEGMRLKRASASAAAKISDNTAIGVHTQYNHSRIGNKGATRQNRRPLQRSADSVSDSDDAVHSMHGSDDDDFIPCKPRRARRAKNGDGLSEVLAWAKSDGTMTSVREKMRPPNRHRRRGSESGGSGSEAEAFSNIILLDGPSGSCKTAAVYACASECGFEVYEIHPGQRRSGKDVLAVLEDVIQSHTIAMPTGNTSGADRAVVNQMLILIEHVDVLFEQDQRLWPALKQLALKSRRPITKPTQIDLSVTPLVLNKSKCANTSAGVTISCTSDVTQLDAISEAMNVLSLVSTFRDGADTINECLCEPLYTSLSPMDDGCLDVSYVVLDPDVITRRNPTRLADSIGVERQTYMQIDEHLRASASQQLCAFPDLGLDSSDSSPSLASQRSELPLGPSILESDYNSTLLNVRSVMSFVGIPSQQMTAEGIADTVACMSAMTMNIFTESARGARGNAHTAPI